jgi:hypothetical protein
MAIYQYVNAERKFAQVVLRGDKVDEVPPNDLTFFVASPEDEMEVYVNDSANGPRAPDRERQGGQTGLPRAVGVARSRAILSARP